MVQIAVFHDVACKEGKFVSELEGPNKYVRWYSVRHDLYFIKHTLNPVTESSVRKPWTEAADRSKWTEGGDGSQ